MEQRDQYFLGHSSAEQRRLQQQAGELAGESTALFDEIGLAPGARVVELGCGPLGCLELLSHRVGKNGAVVGVEMSKEAVALARAFMVDHEIANVEVRQGDAKATGLPRGSFDLATARLVLVNVPAPEAIVAEMVALVRPGGAVALHEADWGMILCDPPSKAWDALRAAFIAYSSANQIDPFIGRRIPRLLRAAGLDDIRVRPLIHLYDPGHSRRPIFMQFAENLRGRIVTQGLMRDSEFAEALAEVKRHLDDPTTLVVWPYFQAWAKRPQ